MCVRNTKSSLRPRVRPPSIIDSGSLLWSACFIQWQRDIEPRCALCPQDTICAGIIGRGNQLGFYPGHRAIFHLNQNGSEGSPIEEIGRLQEIPLLKSIISRTRSVTADARRSTKYPCPEMATGYILRIHCLRASEASPQELQEVRHHPRSLTGFGRERCDLTRKGRSIVQLLNCGNPLTDV